jgi:hypothetical protein
MRDHLLLLQLDKMGGNFQRRQKEKERETDYLLRQFDKYSHYPFQFNKAEQDSCVKLTQKYLLLAYIQNRMAAFLTCGNGRITLLKNSCPSRAAAAYAAAPALLTTCCAVLPIISMTSSKCCGWLVGWFPDAESDTCNFWSNMEAGKSCKLKRNFF